MDRDKLIGIIIKKETYKNAKPVLADIQRKKEEAVNVSISAITHILKDDYNAQAKLYAIRFLKDCFEKGNQNFISKTESKILPVMVSAVKDTGDENSIMKYGGSYTKKTDLQKFKSFVTSFFTICRQCIEKWAEWIPDPNRGFKKAQKAVTSCIPNPHDKGFMYFKPDHDAIFRQNCKQNGLSIPAPRTKNSIPQKDPPPPQSQPSSNLQKNPSQLTTPKPQQSHLKPVSSVMSNKPNCKAIKKIQKIIEEASQKMMDKSLSDREVQDLEGKFNAAINQYIEQADPFDEHFLQQKLEEFQKLKIKNKQPKNQMGEIVDKPVKVDQQKFVKAQDEIIKSQKASKNTSEVKQNNSISAESNVKKVSQPKKQAPSFKDLHAQANQVPPSIEAKTMRSRKQQSSRKSNMKNQSRVNFQQSESDYSDQERDLMDKLRKNNQSESSTAKFIQDDMSSLQRKKQELELASFKMPKDKKVQKQPSRIQFNNSISESKLKSSIPDFEEIQRIKRENEINKRQKQELKKKMENLQKDMNELKQEEKKLMGKIGNSVMPSQIEFLKKELNHQKEQKTMLNQQILQLRSQLRNLQNKFQKSHQEWKNMSSLNPSNLQPYSDLENSRASYKVKKVKKSMVQQSQVEDSGRVNLQAAAPQPSAPYSPRVDEDYVNNLTHFSKIASWMNDSNVLKFKTAILGSAQVFYEDSNICISKLDNLFTEEEEDFLKLTYSFKFRRYQNSKPKVTYKNIPEIDLWVKPISGQEEIYTQQTLSKVCMVPLKLIKASVVFDDGNSAVTFLLPFMYFNFLKPVQFDPPQFQQVFAQKYEGIIKSKVFRFNDSLAGNARELKKVFRQSFVRKSYIEMCLSEQSKQRIFMVQVQVLRNQKGVLRVLPIPGNENMAIRAKQLLNNLLFLLSQ